MAAYPCPAGTSMCTSPRTSDEEVAVSGPIWTARDIRIADVSLLPGGRSATERRPAVAQASRGVGGAGRVAISRRSRGPLRLSRNASTSNCLTSCPVCNAGAIMISLAGELLDGIKAGAYRKVARALLVTDRCPTIGNAERARMPDAAPVRLVAADGNVLRPAPADGDRGAVPEAGPRFASNAGTQGFAIQVWRGQDADGRGDIQVEVRGKHGKYGKRSRSCGETFADRADLMALLQQRLEGAANDRGRTPPPARAMPARRRRRATAWGRACFHWPARPSRPVRKQILTS
jgi:hypothetical protein